MDQRVVQRAQAHLLLADQPVFLIQHRDDEHFLLQFTQTQMEFFEEIFLPILLRFENRF